jgi:hypothetical protein
MDTDAAAKFEQNVRRMYDQMARIAITPTWAPSGERATVRRAGPSGGDEFSSRSPSHDHGWGVTKSPGVRTRNRWR